VVYYGERGRAHDYLKFVYLHIFERTAEGLLSGEEMKPRRMSCSKIHRREAFRLEQFDGWCMI
jgi:hypothetical protein